MYSLLIHPPADNRLMRGDFATEAEAALWLLQTVNREAAKGLKHGNSRSVVVDVWDNTPEPENT